MKWQIFWLQAAIGTNCIEKVWLQQEKKQKRYYEADESKRAIYLEKIAGIKLKNIAYIDETGFDEYYSRQYGYSKRGQRIIGKVFGRKIFRTNLVAGLVNGKAVAAQLYKENTSYLLLKIGS